MTKNMYKFVDTRLHIWLTTSVMKSRTFLSTVFILSKKELDELP